jgi:hypothetical protein
MAYAGDLKSLALRGVRVRLPPRAPPKHQETLIYAGSGNLMSFSIDGFYAAYLTGSVGQGFAMLVFRHGTIVGVDVAGAKYDGTYSETANGFLIKLKVSLPPNTLLVQGISTGPQGDNPELDFQLPVDFRSQPFIRVNAKHGPVNVKIIKLRELND